MLTVIFMEKLDRIIVPMGPSKRVDKIRAQRAYEIGGEECLYLISGGDLSRLNLIPRYLNHLGVDNSNLIINEDSGSYAHIFRDFLNVIGKEREVGISTNFEGFKRFSVYLESAKREDLVPQENRLVGLNSCEWIKSLILPVEWRGLRRDRYFFRGNFTEGLEEKSKVPRTKVGRWDIRKIGS
jgi:hypothetical protein